VIDDDATARDLVGRFLTGEGFAVLLTSSGEEGLRLAREQRPDIIAVDIIMPGMDGWAVLAELKADPALAAVPVILISVTDDRNLGVNLQRGAFMREWGLPTRSATMGGDKVTEARVGRWSGYMFSGQCTYEVWTCEKCDTLPGFHGVRPSPGTPARPSCREDGGSS
jgi:CheY-like chemotaxis protein